MRSSWARLSKPLALKARSGNPLIKPTTASPVHQNPSLARAARPLCPLNLKQPVQSKGTTPNMSTGTTSYLSELSTAALEAPVRAMFAPPRTKAELKKRKNWNRPIPEPYSLDDVIWHDVRDFLGAEYVDKILAEDNDAEWQPPAELGVWTEQTLRIGTFTVSGDALGLYERGGKKWAVLLPFAHPGDLVRVKIVKHNRLHSSADLLEILEYSEEHRGGEGDRRKFPQNGCKYFGSCGGCQFQPMPYALQLLHKKRTLDLAYKRFSRLAAQVIPPIQDTIPSPKQWKYRTKITPHFDAMPLWLKRGIREKDPSFVQEADGSWRGMVRVDPDFGKRKKKKAKMENNAAEEDEMNVVDGKKEKRWELRVGFDARGTGTLDIEECPIATQVLNDKMIVERERVHKTIASFDRGATLLLRDSLPAPEPSSISPFDPATPVIPDEEHVAITDHKLPVYERIGDHLFTFTAGSFFQNNNSILVPLTEYVRDAIFPLGISDDKKPTHLVDTYCGSGLFGIALSSRFERVAGVEIDPQAVEAAQKNAKINGLGNKSTWLCGKAENIFGGLADAGFAGRHSCVVVDVSDMVDLGSLKPPRKGCDEAFLDQLLRFKPLTILYVSCNVHTQARDVGWFLQVGNIRGIKYTLESLRGFDLFPQTAHVEGVAVLRLAE